MAKKINSLDYVLAYEELKSLQQTYGHHYQMSLEVLKAKIHREFHYLRKPVEPMRPSSPLRPSLHDFGAPYEWFQWLFTVIKIVFSLPVMTAQLFKSFLMRIIVFAVLATICYLWIPSILIGSLMSLPIIGFAQMTANNLTMALFLTFLRAGLNLMILTLLVLIGLGVFKYIYLLQSTKVRQARYDMCVEHYHQLLVDYPNQLKAWESKLSLLNQLIESERDELLLKSAKCRALLNDIPVAYQTDELMDYLKFGAKTRYATVADLVKALEQRQQELDLQAIEEEKERIKQKELEKELEAQRKKEVKEKVEAEVVEKQDAEEDLKEEDKQDSDDDSKEEKQKDA